VAQINDCTICLGWRSGRDVAGRTDQAAEIDEPFYAAVMNRQLAGLSARERLGAMFAEKFCVDHRNIDDTMWAELHTHFSDDELVEMALSVGAWLATGRFNQVFDIDGGCRVDAPG
jgi:alkylhydroperoxidase family enzyme